MEKIAFLFSGQGSQFVGMSKSLYDNYEVAKQTFEEANDVLGFDLKKLCFEGRLAELTQTVNAQVAILTSSVATFRAYMQEIGIRPQFCAGHSMGEYSALTCAGVIKFCDALTIVRQRGILAQEIVDSNVGAMTIIDGIGEEFVQKECDINSKDSESVSVSCYNAPEQVAISGHTDAVMRVEDSVLEVGGKTTPLFGSAPFHSALMENAACELRKVLEKYEFSEFRYPVISNVLARPYNKKSEIPEMLVQQFFKPVRWKETIQYMERKGVTLMVEIGPKNVLCNLVKQNTSKVKACCYGQNDGSSYMKDLVSKNDQLKKYVTTIVTECLVAAVATPNNNFDSDEYHKGVVENYKKLEQIKNRFKGLSNKTDIDEMKNALRLLKSIFKAKKLPEKEQKEWFDRIIDSTGMNYLLRYD